MKIIFLFITILIASLSYNRFEWPQKGLGVKGSEEYPKVSLKV